MLFLFYSHYLVQLILDIFDKCILVYFFNWLFVNTRQWGVEPSFIEISFEFNETFNPFLMHNLMFIFGVNDDHTLF